MYPVNIHKKEEIERFFFSLNVPLNRCCDRMIQMVLHFREKLVVYRLWEQSASDVELDVFQICKTVITDFNKQF